MLIRHTMPEGLMQYDLMYLSPGRRYYKPQWKNCEAWAIWMMDGDNFIGWTLFFTKVSMNQMIRSNHKWWSCQVWVNRKYRRMGIGSQLLKLARKKSGDKTLNVQPWDDIATAFHDQNEVKI